MSAEISLNQFLVDDTFGVDLIIFASKDRRVLEQRGFCL